MALKPYLDQTPFDEKMSPRYWRNNDAQDHVFVSRLPQVYPTFPDVYPKIIAKSHKITLIPHGYYVIYTRDDTPAKGTWIVGEQVEDYSEKTLSRGDQSSPV